MKNKTTIFFVFFCLCFSINNSFAQHEHHHDFQPHQMDDSEVPIYKQIKVVINSKDDIGKIAQLGIDLQCGASTKQVNGQNVLILEVSENEYESIKSHNLNPEVLIDDLSKFYEERNIAELPAAKAALRQAKQDALLKNTEVGQDIGCIEDQLSVPQNFELGSMGGFTTYQEMLDELDQMRSLYPNLISARTPASNSITTIEGRTVYYVRLSDNPDADENEAEVLYTGVHHAREPLSMMNLLYYMWYLLENYATDPTVKNIVDNTEMYFIPVVNPDGYLYNQQTNPNGGGMWRKNRRNNGGGTYGVDPNRNYAYNWGYDNTGSSPTPSSDTYRGSAPFSEPETQIVRNFVQSHNFANTFNNHSYSNLLLHPWGYTPDAGPDEELYDEISEHMCWHNRYHYGNGNEVIYPTNGGANDWFYGEEDILAWTPEIGSAAEGSFWPSPSDVVPQCQRQMKMSLILAYSAANYGVLNDLTTYRLDPQSPELTFSVEHMSNVNGAFTVSVSSSSPYVTSITNSTMNTGTITDANFATVSTAVTLDPNTPPGTVIDFDVVLNNGTFDIHTTTISKMYSAYELLYDNASSMSNWTSSGGWGVSGAGGYLDGNSLTDSPSGNMSTATRTLTLINPIDLSSTSSAVLEYYTKWDVTRLFDYVQIEASTDGSSWSELCGVYTKPGTSPDNIWGGNGSPDQPTGEGLYDGFQKEWVREEIDLSAYAGTNTVYLRFKADGDTERAQSDGFYFDDFRIYRAPLGHCENGVQDADETDVDCGGVDCLACPTCTDGIQNGNETGIDCGGDCGICPVCPTSISSFPYTEGFESGLGQWSQSGGDDLDWTRDSGGTPSSNTGPSSAYEGSWYMYIEASNPNFPTKTAGLISPCFNLTGMQTASLTFQYHMYGTAADMDLDVQVSTDGGASWSNAIWSQTGDQGNQWNSATVNLDAYAGQYVMLRFWGTTGETWQGDVSIDDIGVDAAPPACTPGTACDDGDPCTAGEVYDANCQCNGGTLVDSDNDGVCDSNDQCPGTDDAIIGTTCDDGDVCTTGDVYDSNCNCAGTVQDADGDGVCDANDICAAGDDNADADGDGTPDACDNCDNTLAGTACDDGDACTTGETYDANCNCGGGTFQDSDNDTVCDANDACPGTDDAIIGTACDDSDPCTANDVYDANCNCAGTFADADGDGVCDANDACPGADDALAGTACDDGDVCTTGETYDTNCNCTGGTFQDTDNDGTCDAQDTCPNDPTDSCNLTYCDAQGTNTNYEHIETVELNGQTNNSGSDGGYGDYTGTPIATLGATNNITLTPGFAGTAYNENWAVWVDFNKDGDFDDTGEQVYTASTSGTTPTSGTFSAPSGIGTTTMRVAMVYNATPTPCGSFQYGEVEDYTVQLTTPCTPGTACDDGDACTTGETYDSSCNCTGGTLVDSDNDGVCDTNDACPGVDDALAGTPCDDTDACTTGDVYDANCNCAGTFADADNDGVCDADDICAAGDDNADADGDGTPDACDNCDNTLAGTACDDGDACTTGETYDANCNCGGGTFQDTDNDTVCDANDACPGVDDALAGTSCDDSDACTTNDVYDANCNCAGTLTDADGDGVCDADDACPGVDDALAGTACDDGDACTTGETYDANCNCTGGTFQDADNDGVCDANDICPNADDGADADSDGTPDACDQCPNDPNDACGTAPTYCTSSSTNTNYEYIQQVVFGNINNTSGNDGGYGDFTSQTANVGLGSSVPFSLTPGFPSSSYNEAWKIWIDFNRDGDFDDAGEEVYSGASTSTLSGNVNIPNSASLGLTGMRVSMQWNNAPSSSCGSFQYGEVEDYTVNITPALIQLASGGFGDNNFATSSSLNLYPNPATNDLNINLNEVLDMSITEEISVIIYSLDGKQVYQNQTGLTDVLNINIQDLPNNQPYLLRLQTDGGEVFTGKFVKL